MRKAERLRLWKKSGWTYRRLGAETRLAHTSLSRAMQGKVAYPKREVVEALAAALRVEPEQLFPSRPTLAAA